MKALEVLNKQKENGLLLIQTELRMRLESANNLALFEEKRINQFFEVWKLLVIISLGTKGRSKTEINRRKESRTGSSKWWKYLFLKIDNM